MHMLKSFCSLLAIYTFRVLVHNTERRNNGKISSNQDTLDCVDEVHLVVDNGKHNYWRVYW
jgi:hypothetical protein